MGASSVIRERSPMAPLPHLAPRRPGPASSCSAWYPDQEPALYLTAAVLGLFLAALTRLSLVFMPRRPQTA